MPIQPSGPRQCYVHHHRGFTDLDAHHVWPQEFGGPTEPENLVWLCPNAHRRVHDYIRALRRAGGKRPLTWRLYGAKVRLVAMAGYGAIVARPE